MAAIIDYLGTGGKTVYGGYTNTSTFEPGILNANPAIFANGKLYNGTTTTGTATVIVECYFSGSAAGVVDLAVGNTATASFFDAGTSSVASSSLTGAQIDSINNGTPCTGGPSVAYSGGVNITTAVTKVKENADMAFADVSNVTAAQVIGTASLSAAITGVNGSFSTIPSIVSAMTTVQDLTDGTNSNKFVGIVPFQWVIGNVTTSGLTLPTNITQQTAKQLIGFGGVAQSLLGAPDANVAYLLTGRNEDSGTRIVSLADSQFGALNVPFQYSITGTSAGYTGFTFNTGGSGTANGGLNTEPNIYWPQDGHSGQASGATVASNLTFPENSSAGVTGNNGGTETDYGIGYVGTADASYAIAGGAHALSYNGVPFSIAAVQTGSYSLWNYEHAYVLSTISTSLKAIALGISDDVFTSTADISPVNGLHAQAVGASAATVPAGILYNSAFTVSRQTEGGVISHN